jgi:5'-3' exonuclease
VLLLIDYSSMLYRAYHAMPSSTPMGGVHGLLGMLARVIASRKPARLALAVDDDWRPEFRVRALPMYKLQRVGDLPDPVTPQEEYGRRLLSAFGFALLGAPGFEAEDVIATLCETAGEPVEILSGDRDLFDLVKDPDVKVLYPKKGVTVLDEVTEGWIEAKYGIPGRRYGEFALLRGDPSDNLPGVAGIGEKTAARLIKEHGSLEGVLNASNLPKGLRQKLAAAEEYLARAREVVLPVRHVPLEEVSLRIPTQAADPEFLVQAAQEHKLEGAILRLLQALGDRP